MTGLKKGSTLNDPGRSGRVVGGAGKRHPKGPTYRNM